MPRLTLREQILRDRLRPLRRTVRGVGRGDPASVHAARTSTRRLRALLPLLALGARTTRQHARRLRRAGRRLGRLRDLDTQLVLVLELQRLDGDGVLVRHLRRALSEERTAAYERLAGRTLERKLERIVDELRAAVRGAEPESAARAHALLTEARTQVVRRTRALRERVEEAGALYEADRIHQIRIGAKKLRYAAEVSAEASGRPSAADLRLLRRTQDILGRLHDVQVLLDRIRAMDRGDGSPSVVRPREYSRVVNLLETRCRRLHARFLRERPALIALCDRLARPPSRLAMPARRVS
jgi:CHAD domain-containing protein